MTKFLLLVTQERLIQQAAYNGQNAASISSAGNALIGWEENATFDIGVDFSLFNNRVSGFLDYYVRDTSDLLYNLPVSGPQWRLRLFFKTLGV